MDRISDSDSEDAGSIPAGATSPDIALAKSGKTEQSKEIKTDCSKHGVSFVRRQQSVLP
jgi:hypothetical protein